MDVVREALSCAPDARTRRATELCAGDNQLRDEVLTLLHHHEQATIVPNEPRSPRAEAPGSETPRTPHESSPDAPNPERTRLGSYSIIRVLGEGGMGIVYLAEQDRPRRTVALKVIRPGLISERQLRRFDLESQMLARLQHPGIAQIYQAATADAGHGPQPFFAMEYVQGESLTAYAARHDLSVRDRIRLFIKICDAVSHAHQKGVIHRDLKPGNILVDASAPPPNGQPKILDFGIARATDADMQTATIHTEAGQIVGTLPYMSPEQISGDPHAIDTRSDVYTLGVILYQLLTRTLPHRVENKTIPEAVRIIGQEEVTPLGAIDRSLRGDPQTIVSKALERDKSRRYQSASDLAADLQRFLADEPILARPPTRRYRARKFIARNRALVTGLAIAGLFLAAGAAATTWQAIVATHERHLAIVRGDEAAHAQRVAEIQAKNARAVNAFLTSMLSSANPEIESDRDLSVRQVIDRAAEQLQRAGAETPEVELRIRDTLVRTYRALGQSDRAEPQARRNLDLAREVFGPDHPETYSAMSGLGLVLKDLRRFDDAEPLIRDAVAGLERTCPPEDRADLARATGLLGQLELERGDYDDAKTHLVRAAAELTQISGPMHPDTIVALENVATFNERIGRLEEAEGVLRQTIAARKAAFGESSVMTAYSLNNLGNILQKRGKYDEAYELCNTALRIRAANLDAEHPSVLVSLNNSAVALMSLGRLNEAEPLMRRCVDGNTHRLGASHPTTLAAMNNLAYILQDLKRLDEAESVFRAALSARRDGNLMNEQDAWLLLNNLAMLLAERGNCAEANALYTEALDLSAPKLSDSHYLSAIIRNNRGECLTKLMRFEDAERDLVRSEESLLKTFKLGHPRVEKARSRLAALYDAWGKPDKAAEYRAAASP
jgi:tetratricopeptide (TPR) repeat protein